MTLKSKGGWNYRVLRYEDGALGIHEVFYTDGKPTSCTEDPVGVVGDDLDEMRSTLTAMALALEIDILDYSMFETRKPEGDDRG